MPDCNYYNNSFKSIIITARRSRHWRKKRSDNFHAIGFERRWDQVRTWFRWRGNPIGLGRVRVGVRFVGEVLVRVEVGSDPDLVHSKERIRKSNSKPWLQLCKSYLCVWKRDSFVSVDFIGSKIFQTLNLGLAWPVHLCNFWFHFSKIFSDLILISQTTN